MATEREPGTVSILLPQIWFYCEERFGFIAWINELYIFLLFLGKPCFHLSLLLNISLYFDLSSVFSCGFRGPLWGQLRPVSL